LSDDPVISVEEINSLKIHDMNWQRTIFQLARKRAAERLATLANDMLDAHRHEDE